jgi:hypothetical protein
MTEEKKVTTEDLRDLKSRWEVLFSNPAWIQLQQALQEQTDSLQNDILFAPVRSAEDAYGVERKKGQLEGRLSISGTALAMYEGVCTDLEERIGDQNEDE